MRRNGLSIFPAPIRLRYLFLTTAVLGLIFFSLTYLGIRKARQSLLKIVIDDGQALMASLTLSSTNAIQAGLLLQSLSEEKFSDLAEIARRRLEGTDDPAAFQQFRADNDLLSIDRLDSNLVVIGSDRWAVGYLPTYPPAVGVEIIDLQQSGGGYRSVMATSDEPPGTKILYFIYALGPDGDLMVMAAPAAYMDQIMEQIGIGYLIRKISEQAGIEYILLQSRDGIVFSSRPLPPILSLESDPFLDSLMAADSIGWRIHEFEEVEVLEIARRFESVTYPAGIYRLGMNLDEFREISRGYDRQIIIVAVILFLLSLLIVAVVSVKRDYSILDASYRQMRSMTETVFDRLSSAVLAYNAEGKVTTVNRALMDMAGFVDDLSGREVDEIADELPFRLPPKVKPGERLVSLEQNIVDAKGEKRTILLGASSLPEEAGGGAVVLIHDVTEQKQLEETSRRQQRLSEMGDMAAGVAHEIRNPLNAIGIAAQRLKMEFAPQTDDDEYGQLTRNILDETERLNTILTRFLELAKTRAAEDKPVDLGKAISRGIASLHDEAKRRGVNIAYRPHETIMVKGVLEKLQQVFINLIKNGIQAMPEGGEVLIEAGVRDNGRAGVTVSDTGPGFSPEVLSKIFQPYFTTKADGSGLGLALAYKTITDCGGAIEAANGPGGGARIEIILPRA